MRRKRDKYIYNPNIRKFRIMSFWEKKSEKVRLATEKFMFSPDIKVKDIQKEFSVYISSIYSHFYRLKESGFVYCV